jgi:hypothetical protein
MAHGTAKNATMDLQCQTVTTVDKSASGFKRRVFGRNRRRRMSVWISGRRA